MHWWDAIALGIVEGLTEYLPVSSTAHLLVVQRLMGIPDDEASRAFAIVIQGGAILAVIGLYLRHVKAMLQGLVGRDPIGLRLAINIVIAFLPAAIIGKFAHHWIENHLEKPWPIVTAWVLGSLVIFAVSKARGRTPSNVGLRVEQIDWKMALLIGLVQSLGMWPGISRSLATIVAGLVVGLSMAAAVEFSFLLGVVTLTAATLYKAREGGHAMMNEYGLLYVALGFITATVAAVLAVKWMVAYLNRRGLLVFGYYRLVAAAIVALLVLTRVLA